MGELYENERFIFDQVPIQVYWHHLEGDDIYTYLHWHTNIEFDLAVSGRIRTHIDGRERILQPGEWIVVNCGELHENHWVEPTDCYEGWTVQFAKTLFDRWLGENLRFCIPDKETARKRIAESIQKFGTLSQRSDDCELEQMEEAFHLMRLLKKYCLRPNEDAGEGSMFEKLKPVLAYLDDHFTENITLAEIAQEFHYSPEHLSRLFKSGAGYTFYQYLQNIRLMHCIDQYKADRLQRLSALALDNGFPNAKSFEAFKRTLGCTPSQWVKQQENG